jgi:predicted RNase H-like HicB family nuclease/DNA-binding XRE family transcriptional regulator
MQYHFKIHKEKKGLWAQCIELPGCVAQGNTLKELNKNMYEALNLYIEEPGDSKNLVSLPDNSIKTSKNIVQIPVDPFISFAFLVRYFRIKNGLTQQEAAKKMGFETVYSYQRLEAKKCNPSLRMITKIKTVFPEFSVDYAIKK